MGRAVMMTTLVVVCFAIVGCKSDNPAQASYKRKMAMKEAEALKREKLTLNEAPDMAVVAKEALRLYSKWKKECKAEHNKYINIVNCIRWKKLFKDYLAVDYVDEAMLIRYHVAMNILLHLGRSLCNTKGEGGKYRKKLVNKELRAVQANMKEMLRKIRAIQVSFRKSGKARVILPNLWRCIAPKIWVIHTK